MTALETYLLLTAIVSVLFIKNIAATFRSPKHYELTVLKPDFKFLVVYVFHITFFS